MAPPFLKSGFSSSYPKIVMAGRCPGHPYAPFRIEIMDGRHKGGHDGYWGRLDCGISSPK
jgi:hypothetical protein